MGPSLVVAEEDGTVSPPLPRPTLGGRVVSALGTLMTLVAVMIGTLAVVIAIASHFSPPGQYTVFGHPVMSVLSGSMTPAIRTGDLIYDDHISLARAEHLRVGEIISFHATTDKTFTHRIHAVETVGGSVFYQTKGDANNAPDQALVAPSQIVGLYQGKMPYGGYFLNALHTPFTLGLLLAAPLLWLLSSWLFEMARRADAKPPAVPRREEAAVM